MHKSLLFLLFSAIIRIGKDVRLVKRCFQTKQYEFTYSENHVDSYVLWDNHCHARYEMIAVLEGDISIMLEGRCCRLTEDQYIIIPPLLYHAVTANKQGDYKRVTAFFDIQAVPSVLREEFTQNDAQPAIYSSSLIKDIRICCQEEKAAYYEPLIESLMIPLFYNSLKAPAAGIGDTEVDQFILKLIKYIDDNLCKRITLEDLARYTARSKSFICHRFREIMGIPPGQYVLQKKMAFAQKMIQEGHPPTLVASQIGYKNYGTFYRMYIQHFRSAPSLKQASGASV